MVSAHVLRAPQTGAQQCEAAAQSDLAATQQGDDGTPVTTDEEP
jgi:hypothetical protein